MVTVLRAQLFHTPGNPFHDESSLEAFDDGALAIENGVIVASGDYASVSKDYPNAELRDRREAIVLPGMVDTHVHLPQIPVIGAMGLRLLDWLAERTLPEEARFKDQAYARAASQTFLEQLARNGTTTALVFGTHFAAAQDIFFEEAASSGLRITSGLVVSDRNLIPELHSSPQRAYDDSAQLVKRWHGKGRLRYAVTPRFSLSCSEEMLAGCGQLLKDHPQAFFTSHLNEQPGEISAVLGLFETARDYLETYESHRLVTARSVFAHNVYPYDRELEVLADADSSVAHCPSSNMFIGSGLFPMKRHLAFGVHFGLGSDVGGGTGFNLFKEGLTAYQSQMLRSSLFADGYPLTPAHLLYLATRAGALALDLETVVGDFSPGKQADYMLLQPPADSTLAATLKHSPSAEASLGALFTLARADTIREVGVAGELVYRTQRHD